MVTKINSGIGSWTLVSSFNHKAQQFYEKMGFIKVGQLDDLIIEGYSEFLLRKSR